ncbi:MAG: hypothetical protein Q7T08_04070 [Devosia sp.]|nr:hypothetical protein [Devosia sp.]
MLAGFGRKASAPLFGALLFLAAAIGTGTAQQGLLSQNDVLAISASVMGNDPWVQPHREQALNDIRDFIKLMGVSFRPTLDFDKRMAAQDTSDVRISDAITVNYGPHPDLADYIGTFLVGDFQPGKVRREVNANGVTIYYSRYDEALEVLEIRADRSFTWDVAGAERGLVSTGRWHEAQNDEKFAYEGGPGIILENAQSGYDYTVRIRRQADFQGWLELGLGRARSPRLVAARP